MGGRIFISHSTKDRKPDADDALRFARAVRERIVEGLSATVHRHTVLIDLQRLEPGDDSCAKLNHWLGICDGAVILLDRTSACSDWLRKEATILGRRAAQAGGPVVIPILLGDFDLPDLEALRYGCLEIDRRQAARAPTPELTEANAAALAAVVVQRLAGLSTAPPCSPSTRWVHEVAKLVGRAPAERLEDVAAALDLDVESQSEIDDLPVGIARQLFSLPLDRSLRGLDVLAEFLDHGTFRRLAAFCLPTWVSTESGAHLSVLLAQLPRQIVAINSAEPDVGKEGPRTDRPRARRAGGADDHAAPRQRPTPRFCSAGASGITRNARRYSRPVVVR